MSRILYFPETYRDDKAIRYDGSTELAYRNNPEYGNDAAGSWIGWVRFPALPYDSAMWSFLSLVKSSTGSKKLFLTIRGATGDDPRRLQVQYSDTGVTGISYHPTGVTANQWHQFCFAADASEVKLVLNNDFSTLVAAGSNPLWAAGQWYGGISGSSPIMTFGAARIGGSRLYHTRCHLNNLIYCNRVLTNSEITEHYNAGRHAHPWNLSFGSAITHRYDFENDLTDAVGGETLTGVSLDASNYIAP